MQLSTQDRLFNCDDPALREAAFKRAKAAGIRRIRHNHFWRSSKDKAGAKNGMLELKRLLTDAKRHGLKVQVTLTGGAAKWTGGMGINPSPRAFQKFVYNSVKQIKRQFPGVVDRYSLWNEPNHASWLKVKGDGSAAARRYGQLYRAGYAAVKKADPKAKIFFGELTNVSALKFVKVAAAGGRIKADGIALHPYQDSDPTKVPKNRRGKDWVGISTLGLMKNLLRQLARQDSFETRKTGTAVPMHITEFGLHRKDGHVDQGDYREIAEPRRARYLTAALRRAQAMGVREFLVYHLGANDAGQPWDTALLDANGKPTRSYEALVRWARKSKLIRP
jgi:hypothetical protein